MTVAPLIALSGGEEKGEEEKVQCKICTGNSREYALLRRVNGSRMNIAH